MNYDDHNPPHFHVRQGNQTALIDIKTGALLAGKLSARALGLVIEWAVLHRSELLENWELAKKHADLKDIAPLE